MNKEKTVLDFAIYVLMEVEELCDYITYFFGQKDKHDPFSDKKLLEYEEYIKRGIDVNEIIINQNYNLELKSITDLLNNEEVNNLLNYLNENFTEGYPDGDGFGAPTNLEFKTADLYRLFCEYLELRQHNQNVFITYYIQLIGIIGYDTGKIIEEEKQKIINIENTKDLLNLDLSREYIENKKREYKLKLFKSVENNNFQLKGFSDEKGLYFDFDKSLISYLQFLNKGDCFKITYSVYYERFENSLDYLLYQFLEDRLFNTENISNKYSSNYDIELLECFRKLKGKYKKLVVYLSDKYFTESEIDNILNVLSGGKYDSLNKRNISIKTQVGFFNFCYSFYILDYFTDKENVKFSVQNNFEYILNFDEDKILDYDKNSFQKYYTKRDEHHKMIKYLYKEIEKNLQIDIDRLKPIQ